MAIWYKRIYWEQNREQFFSCHPPLHTGDTVAGALKLSISYLCYRSPSTALEHHQPWLTTGHWVLLAEAVWKRYTTDKCNKWLYSSLGKFIQRKIYILLLKKAFYSVLVVKSINLDLQAMHHLISAVYHLCLTWRDSHQISQAPLNRF